MNTGSGLNRSAIQSEISRCDDMSSLTRPTPRIPTAPAAMNGNAAKSAARSGRAEGAGGMKARRNGFASLQHAPSDLPPPSPPDEAPTPSDASTRSTTAIAVPAPAEPGGDRGEREEKREADRAGEPGERRDARRG